MEIKNHKQSPCPIVPKELEGKIKFTADCVLSERDWQLFNNVLLRLVEQMKEENFIFTKVKKTTVIFVETYDFGLILDSSEKATYTRMIVYPVIEWEKIEMNENKKLMAFTEELCHHFWMVDDEEQVSYPVFRVLNRMYENDYYEQKINELKQNGIEEPKDFAHF
jgi:hemerythrin-like domain-containing protein